MCLFRVRVESSQDSVLETFLSLPPSLLRLLSQQKWTAEAINCLCLHFPFSPYSHHCPPSFSARQTWQEQGPLLLTVTHSRVGVKCISSSPPFSQHFVDLKKKSQEIINPNTGIRGRASPVTFNFFKERQRHYFSGKYGTWSSQEEEEEGAEGGVNERASE